MQLLPDLKGKLSLIYPGVSSTDPSLSPHNYPGGLGVALPLLKSRSGDTRVPIIHAEKTLGKFVRALIEDEEPGMRLLAYDCVSSIKEVLSEWEEVTSQKPEFATVSLEEICKETGLPVELMEPTAFLGEFNICDGVEGKLVLPSELRRNIVGMSIGEIMQDIGKERLLRACEKWGIWDMPCCKE